MYDVVIIGAGIAGCSLVYELEKHQIKAVLIEKENDILVRMTEANSVIVHGDYDPPPGSKVARHNITENTYIKELCGKPDIPYKQIGVLIMVSSEVDERTSEELKDRNIQNGVKGMEIWDKERLHRGESHVSQEAGAALYSSNVGIINPWGLTLAPAEVAAENDVKVKLNTGVKNAGKTDTGHSIEINQGVIDTACVCNAVGMSTDEINEMVNDATFKMEPSKGEYYPLDKSQGNLVSHVTSRCPNENGKSILVTPTAHGNLIVGPGSQPTSREDVSIAAEDLSYVRNTALGSIPNINFHEPIRNFTDVRARTKEDNFFIYEDPENRLFYSIVGMTSPGLSSAPIIALDVIGMMEESGPSLTKRGACMDTRNAVRLREMNHEGRTALIKKHPEYERIICRCETVAEGEIIDAVHRPVPTVSIDAVKRRYNARMGHCQDGFRGLRVQEIIVGELKKNLKDVPPDREGIILITGETRAAGDEQE